MLLLVCRSQQNNYKSNSSSNVGYKPPLPKLLPYLQIICSSATMHRTDCVLGSCSDCEEIGDRVIRDKGAVGASPYCSNEKGGGRSITDMITFHDTWDSEGKVLVVCSNERSSGVEGWVGIAVTARRTNTSCHWQNEKMKERPGQEASCLSALVSRAREFPFTCHFSLQIVHLVTQPLVVRLQRSRRLFLIFALLPIRKPS